MMSVYIEGVEMPTDHPMWIVVHSDGTVEASEISPGRPVGWRTLRNAAISVPQHGRLIDADAFTKDECNNCDGACEALPCDCLNCEADCRCDFMQDIANAPTIIPAEVGS